MRDPSQDVHEPPGSPPAGPSHSKPASSSNFNRRDFLRGSGAAVAATALVTTVQETVAEETAKAAKIAPAKPMAIKLTINGKEHALLVEPRVTLLDALREDLQLTGAKEVCTTTNCGACTVLVDGKPVYGCAKLAIECQGAKITTVEGLGEKSPVVQCFVKHDATQCGFCTPGFVVATTAFVEQNPDAKLADVLKGLGGNICRCGTYVGVAEAALECAHSAKKGG